MTEAYDKVLDVLRTDLRKHKNYHNFNFFLRRTAMVMLRLGRDDQCYDLLDFATNVIDSDPSQDYDAKRTLLQRRLEGLADVSQFPLFDVAPEREFDLLKDARIMILLLRMRVVLDIRYIKVARQLLATSPWSPETRRLIERELYTSPLTHRLLNRPTQALDVIAIEFLE